MNHVGTFSRNSRYHRVFRGLRNPFLACLLVASASAHATVNPDGLYVMSSTSTGVKTGQYIEAAASARYQPYFGSTKLYTKALVPVSTATLRRGALYALSRGTIHPGFAVAVMAAGFLLEGDQVKVERQSSGGAAYPDTLQDDAPSGSLWYNYNRSGSVPAIYGYSAHTVLSAHASHVGATCTQFLQGTYGPKCYLSAPVYGNVEVRLVSDTGQTVTDFELGTTLEPATEQELETIDPYIPPQLYDELYNDGSIPVWQDEITVLGSPATAVQPTGDQAVAPEVATKVGQWAANAQAQIDGVAQPYPDNDAIASTAEDKLLEDLDLDGPIPPFPGTEPEWQVETIDAMPTWSAGIGEATCPPPTVITLWSDLSFELPYQPLCDFAGFIRAVVIAAAGIASLFIVLGRSS